MAYKARKSGVKSGERVSPFARQQNLFAFDDGATVSDYTNATIMMLADIVNGAKVTELKKTISIYNDRARDTASGQSDIFSAELKTKEDILKEVNELLNYGTEEAKESALSRADASRRASSEPVGAESVEQDGTAGVSREGSADVEDSVQAALAAGEQETNTEPTEAQKEAGNYKKGHVKIDGYNITIENPKGSERSGQDKDGKKWSITMNNTYGYILGTEGIDGDHIDVFLSDNPSEGNVYVVDQVNADGSFDEHKVMYGFPDIESARKAYLSNYEEGWQGLGNITGISKEEFKKWVDSSHRKTKPFAEYSSVKPLGDTIPDSNVTASVNKLNETNNDEQPQSKLAEYRTEYPGRVFGEQHEDGSVTFHDEDAMLVSELLNREFDGEDLTLPKKEADKALQKLLANGHKVAFYGDEYKPKYDEHGNLIEQNTDPQPKGKGMFGNIYDQFKGKAKEAIAFLLQKKEGEATGALHHKDIGDIDLVWGEEGTGKSDGFGLAKLVKYHPEVLDNLQNILDDMHVVQRSDNRVRLESVSHQAAVRLTWDNQKKNWLLTAFEKKNSAPDNTTDTAETLKEGERNDTATPQNTVSIGKDTDKSSSVQENGGKNAETRETALRDGLIDKLRSAGIEVITDEEEAQRVLDADRERRARLMGSRVEKRKQEIAAKLEGKEMSDEQRTVVNVFTGRNNNLTLNITDKSGKSRSIVMRQGNELNAGTKHSIYRHYGTSSNGYTAEEIMLIPDIIRNGERHQDSSKGISYSYEKEGTKYTVTTEIRGKGEQFTNFYTNRKPTAAEQGTQNTDEQRVQPQQSVSGAKLQKVSDFANYSPVFYSNAEKAVEGISQNKATAEQWLAMIQKQGGLKAGEDKWLGLRDWLTARKGHSLTKEELLDYIRENQVHVDEVSYTANPQGFEDLKREYDGWLRNGGYDYAWEQLRERFGDDADIAFTDFGGELEIDNPEAASALLGSEMAINSIRLDYTTEGLDNKREIALTVPDIDSWNENDEVHFGDAGQGRAVAWVRFGETTDSDGNRVLVIDEIQSKRHQEGREQGYITDEDKTARRLHDEYVKAREMVNDYETVLERKYNVSHISDEMLTEEEAEHRRELWKAVQDARDADRAYNNAHPSNRLAGGIPDAPFEKNWHELAMKRMLRYAAENGFDKVAWTMGEQQAERYNIGGKIERIVKTDDHVYEVYLNNKPMMDLEFDEDGIYRDEGDPALDGKSISDVFGKSLAERLDALPVGERLQEDGLRMGGEGMKGFYDEILPRFMDKYGKKWGIKTVDVTLPYVEESGRTMHSVDVTPEMRESVMEGQPMFLRTDSGEVYGFTKDGKIYIDPRKATAETPVHEFTHLWADGLRRANPKAWEQLKSELEKEKDLFDYVKSLYPELSGDDLIDEVFAHFSGRRGAERLRSEQEKMMQKANGIFDKAKITTMFDRLRNILHDFWAQARDLFAGKTEGIERLSAEDFADMALADLIKGEKPLAEGKKETRFNKAAGLDVRTYDNSNHQTRDEERERVTKEAVSDRDDILFRNDDVSEYSFRTLRSDRFYNGISNSDAFAELLDENTSWVDGSLNLLRALKKRFGGEVVSASSGAKYALEHGLVPVPDGKYSGKYGEYHHIEFESDNGERFVESVPFVDAESVGDDYGIRYRIRKDEPPKKTGIGYKVFVLKDGKLYPPMVANPNGEATPVGVWLDADAAPVAGVTKTGRQQVKAGGKGTQGGSGKLAYRPGWHLGEIPYALQFNRMDPETGQRELFPANFVWAEVEYANDVDYQEEAMSYGMNASGKFQHSLAGLPRLPENGSYKYRTNPNPNTDPWVITGAMKVNRILKPSEVDAMVEAAGREPQRRQAGAITDEQVEELNVNARHTMQGDRDLMRSVVQQMSEKLHTDINIIDDVNEITHPNAAVQERMRKSKGWYDTATGQVNIVLDNNRDVDDVKASVGHETIAHKGLRELVGEDNYGEFLDETYLHLRDDLKKGVDDAAGRAFVNDTSKNGKRAKSYEHHRRIAVDELFGRLAEKPFDDFSESERTLWQDLKTAVRRLLDKFLGSLKLPKWFELGDNELRYILWRSKERLERGKEHPIDLARDIVKREELGLTDEARYNMGDAPETFKARQRRAAENKGTVMPGLNDAQVKVVDVPRHQYKGRNILDQARDAAIERYNKQVGTNEDGTPKWEAIPQYYNNYGISFFYEITPKALKSLVQHHTKSDNVGVHAAVLDKLHEVINGSIEYEEDPDVPKINGVRDITKGVNDNVLIHRFIGAVRIDGKNYRVISKIKEYRETHLSARPSTYQVTEIEVFDEETPNTPNGSKRANGYVHVAKLLKDFEKKHDGGKKNLMRAKILTKKLFIS